MKKETKFEAWLRPIILAVTLPLRLVARIAIGIICIISHTIALDIEQITEGARTEEIVDETL